MNEKKDISIIEWQPLPAPKDRYLIVRYQDEEGTCSEMAYSIDGTRFLGDIGAPFHADIEAWAYFPYDIPSSPEDAKIEAWLRNILRRMKKDKEALF